ncbi:MAG: MFS transporter [Rhodospirillales bacterium]|nr:MFS transporter [Rhodospirillales bacterium]
MAGVFAFPALLPNFVDEWRLSNTEAGWISGLYFAAHALSAPPIVALTDRIDARRIYVAGALLAALAAVGFSLFADGFWSALTFRVLAGIALAATYMPGLRLLVDRYRGETPSRAISFYTASFSLGTAFSFFLTGQLATEFGWRAAFAATAAAALIAAVVPLALGPALPEHAPVDRTGDGRGVLGVLDIRPVLANRAALSYIVSYGVHCWELFALRSWLVAFLSFCVGLQAGTPAAWIAPTTVATLSGLVAMAASIGGNELALSFGRRRLIALVMVASAAAAAGIGFTVSSPYALVVGLALAYTLLVQLDSAALTAGSVETALPGQRGATLALHSLFGFGCAGIGPVVFGRVLDASGGGGTASSWGLAFLSVAVVGTLGPLALFLLPLRLAPPGDKN